MFSSLSQSDLLGIDDLRLTVTGRKIAPTDVNKIIAEVRINFQEKISPANWLSSPVFLR